MQFTPQQMAGGPKFSPVTRVGNWQEEIALEEAKIANFQKRSLNGNLSIRKLESKMSLCNEIVPHTYSDDGLIRFGDTILLEHESTHTILACDPFEESVTGQEKYLVSTIVQEPVPKAMNAFRVVRPPQRQCNLNDNMDDPVLHIGQPFLLACNESLLVSPNSNILSPTLYLSSTKKNERTATKRTNRQMVYMSPHNDGEAVWIAIIPSKGRANASERFLAMGLPLSIRDAVQITHRQTNMYLTCDAQTRTQTEFGVEYEAFADRSTASGKLGLMVSEFKGLSTSQTLSKPDAPNFTWHFLTAGEPAHAVDRRQLPKTATRESILLEAREMVKSRGVDGFWNLRDLFRQLEHHLHGSGKMDREDLKAALLDWGLDLHGKYLDALLDTVDTGRLGLVSLHDLLAVIRGPMPPHRERIVRAVFDRLDRLRDDHVDIDDIALLFDGAEHPLCTIGQYSEQEALDHVLRSFETRGGGVPKKIHFERFADYYADLSAAIDDDDYFATVVQSNWARAGNSSHK